MIAPDRDSRRLFSRDAIDHLHSWLINSALNFWCEHGIDKKNGGFYEILSKQGIPVTTSHRTRCIARQIFAFSKGKDLGWEGPSDALVIHGLHFLEKYLIHSDGTVITEANLPNTNFKTDQDPYDYACVLLALAQASKQHPNGSQHVNKLATKILNRLSEEWRHPDHGFQEDPNIQPFLRANPHMHLLEAFLAWEESHEGNKELWKEESDKIAMLAFQKLINKDTGAIYEFFNQDWTAPIQAKHRIIEPGHLFEWSWLLSEWGLRRGNHKAIDYSLNLINLGEKYGVDTNRGLAINTLNEDCSPINFDARLWPQAERIKAWNASLHFANKSSITIEQAERQLIKAIASLDQYFKDMPPGLWHEEIMRNGNPTDSPIRASGLYHLTMAVSTLIK